MGSIKYEISDNNAKFNKIDDNRYNIELSKGHHILMYNENVNPDFIIEPVTYQSGKENSYGLNKNFLEKREFMKELFFEGY